MLAKLLKYDFKSMFKIFLPLWAALLVVSAVNHLFSGSGLDLEHGLGIVNSLMVVLYVLLIMAVMVVTTVIIIVRFYQGLLKDEGYLMFTIPVRAWQLITSKLISAVVVSLLSGLVAVVSVFIIAAVPGMFQAVGELWQAMAREVPNLGLLVALLVASIFVGIICSVTQVYASMALGHLAGRHRVGFAVLAFIVLGMIWSAVGTLVGELGYPGLTDTLVITATETGVSMNAAGVSNALVLGLAWGIGIDLVRCVVHFVITNYILSRKLNLE